MVYGTNSFYNLKHASLTYMPKKTQHNNNNNNTLFHSTFLVNLSMQSAFLLQASLTQVLYSVSNHFT